MANVIEAVEYGACMSVLSLVQIWLLGEKTWVVLFVSWMILVLGRIAYSMMI